MVLWLQISWFLVLPNIGGTCGNGKKWPILLKVDKGNDL